MNYKQAAKEILEKAQKPLHYKEITRRAFEEGLIESEGETPWATMNAKIAVDMKNNGEKSPFYRAEPGFYAVKIDKKRFAASERGAKITGALHKITDTLTSKQKGDLAEARVAELITLYGDEGLSCYRPMSDDEGIDIIVKRRGKLEVVFVQVKSTFGYGSNRGFVSTVKEKNISNKAKMMMVFVYFDLAQGDLHDQVFCVPASEFLKLTESEKKNTEDRVFTVGLSKPDKSKYAEYMIEKRELANKILEYMNLYS